MGHYLCLSIYLRPWHILWPLLSISEKPSNHLNVQWSPCLAELPIKTTSSSLGQYVFFPAWSQCLLTGVLQIRKIANYSQSSYPEDYDREPAFSPCWKVSVVKGKAHLSKAKTWAIILKDTAILLSRSAKHKHGPFWDSTLVIQLLSELQSPKVLFGLWLSSDIAVVNP